MSQKASKSTATGSGKKVRKCFSQQEDALLTQIMFQQPFETWIAVAEQLPGRTARQCRDRWVNYLSPRNKNGPWSVEEDQLLSEKYNDYGSQWTAIAKFFDGRSENNVKNRWYTYVRHRVSNLNGLEHKQQTITNTESMKTTPLKPSLLKPQQIQQPIPTFRAQPIIRTSQKIPTMTPSPNFQITNDKFVLPNIPQPITPNVKKPLLPPISSFDTSVPPIPPHTRFHSESVRPNFSLPLFQY